MISRNMDFDEKEILLAENLSYLATLFICSEKPKISVTDNICEFRTVLLYTMLPSYRDITTDWIAHYGCSKRGQVCMSKRSCVQVCTRSQMFIALDFTAFRAKLI